MGLIIDDLVDKLGYLGLVLIITEDGSLQQFVKVEPELSN